MQPLEFVSYTIALSASGALSPGPLSFTALLQGSRSGAKAGLMIAVGHMTVEFPLVIVLSLGLASLVDQPSTRMITGLVGGVALAAFGGLQAYGSLRANKGLEDETRLISSNGGLFVLGAALTGLNPFFIAWWLSVGIKLVVDAMAFASLSGILLMYSAHVWLDYLYLVFISYAARKGMRFLGGTRHRVVAGLLGLLFVWYGASFVISVL